MHRALRPLALALLPLSLALVAVAAADDRQRAEASLARLAAAPSGSAVAAEPIARARQALARGDDARQRGARLHAGLYDALGREWAELGVDLVRATDAERSADALEDQLQQLAEETSRAKARLEDAAAREGRALEALEALEAPAPASSREARP